MRPSAAAQFRRPRLPAGEHLLAVVQYLPQRFLALAAGSILYVVIELLAVARKLGHKDMTTWGILAGLILGFATDFILTAVGA